MFVMLCEGVVTQSRQHLHRHSQCTTAAEVIFLVKIVSFRPRIGIYAACIRMQAAYIGMQAAYIGMQTACIGMGAACIGIRASCIGMDASYMGMQAACIGMGAGYRCLQGVCRCLQGHGTPTYPRVHIPIRPASSQASGSGEILPLSSPHPPQFAPAVADWMVRGCIDRHVQFL